MVAITRMYESRHVGGDGKISSAPLWKMTHAPENWLWERTLNFLVDKRIYLIEIGHGLTRWT